MKRWMILAAVVGVGLLAVLLIVPLFHHGWHDHGPLYDLHLRRMVDGAVSYHQREFADRDGNILPRAVPDSAAPVGEPCGPPATPEGPTWAALHIGDPVEKMRLVYLKAGPDAFVARVHGDLDCDGVLSTFERRCELADDTYECSSARYRDEE